jgi:6-pyruvoyltetrahydropterin/6-carboxytetrahydropterin synthase
MFEVSVTGSFEASHYIDAPGGAEAYKRVHGHSFVVTAACAGHRPGEAGWVLDLGALDAALKDVLAELDHSVLNDIPGLEQPTFENLLLWIEAGLKAKGFTPSRLEIERPTVRQRAVYTPSRQ